MVEVEQEKRVFYCPYCGEKLSFLDGTIIKMDGTLDAEHFAARTQFFFPARLGQYGAIVAGNVQLKEGAKVEFHCINPKCDANFTTVYNHDLAEIRMVDGNNREYVVVFNKIYGRRATFLVDHSHKTLVRSFGEHADSYAETFERPLNYFGAV